MDCSLPVVPGDGDMRWSDSHSMDSDDIQSIGLPSPWLGSLSTGSTSVSVSSSSSSSTMGFAHTGQLSPISNGADVPCEASDSAANLSSPSQSPPVAAMVHPGRSSTLSHAWSVAYTAAEDAAELPVAGDRRDSHNDSSWEHGSDDMLTVPKLEPMDDEDFCMDDLKEAPLTPVATASSLLQALEQPKPKRPRGRPRKHPLTPNVTTNKITKGRSKTGCLTCRKRKKKCDEAKPRCMNCEKNAVVCEGYPEKQIWKSGKERAEEERLKSRNFPSITMQPLFHGLETVEDMIFWKHYNEHLSAVLTVEGEHKNAFKDMMVPVAVKHQGLMHSILSLASKHIDFETPYGINVLRNNPTTTIEALRERSIYHHEQARLKFYDDVEFTNGKPNMDDKVLVSARYGQMLCFLLEAQAEGSSRGEHRCHLEAYRNLISTSPPDDSAFMAFIAEFFQYHIYADELIHSAISRNSRLPSNPLSLIPAIHPPRLLGVADGLLDYLSQITVMRNTVRSKMMAQVDPAVTYCEVYPASAIDQAIREWTPNWPPGDSRDRVGLLYQHMIGIYLHRTIYPPSPSPSPSMTSSTASLALAQSLPSRGRPTSSVVNTPPQSASTSCASSPRLTGSNPGPNAKAGRPNPLLDASPRKNSGPETGTTADVHANEGRVDSPPPIRHPPQREARLTLMVDESLAILETFKPSDPSQTLLLLPCFVIGTVCFSPSQQERVRAAIRTVRGYTGLRNADRVVDVLEEVWRLMETGEWVAVWDWAGVAHSLGLDFIPA
ncbi:Transcriptional regulatory protein moc3 [Madurella mycetomatis]|uniref:Transcriptional regulatory protein moc3 n=1 Tax=Madurella mycetomatis TaxID=100816 RepID=A0A175W5C7_9PEZI|nr:Transcriptional regulatory protein moc3 [Madurella mycetomatis]